MLTGCSTDFIHTGGTLKPMPEIKDPFNISIMTTSFTNNPATEDSSVFKSLEEYTNTKLNINWVNNSSYNDKMNIALASGELPNIMLVTSKSSSVISAARADAFWELKSYMQNYPNLRLANQTSLSNISIDSKVYGIPRMRSLGRYGIVYRKDWLNNVGLSEPESIDDFYNMLKAFTQKDPDKNGKNDTYGLILSMADEPFDIISSWFGVANVWGEDSNGQLVPAHTTPEYKEALKFLRKLYSEKLVNQDFTIVNTSRWNDPFVNGVGGCIVDVVDRANTLASRLDRAGDSNSVIDVLGTVSGPKGDRTLSTSGNAGFYAIAKSSVRTETDLKQVLDFIDKVNDKKAQDLLYYGIEGRHYVIDNGYAVRKTSEGVSESERNDLSMLLTFIPRDYTTPVQLSPLREKVNKVQSENEKIVVSNPVEGLTSDVYTEKGDFLDNMINQARLKYITGEIDDSALENIFKSWLDKGGSDYIKEVNKKYLESKSKK
jgi:ABC-type sugar transport system, periplasmic component